MCFVFAAGIYRPELAMTFFEGQITVHLLC